MRGGGEASAESGRERMRESEDEKAGGMLRAVKAGKGGTGADEEDVGVEGVHPSPPEKASASGDKRGRHRRGRAVR